ncbi:MAG: hypothetical protein KAT85_08805, partial [candidate division Zixibacteria bacterium]|nr:hypothetical protein [candidate division Zixibacteria bacterium]
MMSEKRIGFPMVLLLAAALVTGGAFADVSSHTNRVTRQINNVLDGSEEHGFSLSASRGVPFTGRITGPGEIMGITYHDYQHNGSMGRQVAYDPINNYVHFVWRHSPAPAQPDVAYNSYDLYGAVWQHGSGATGGKVISTDGYTAGYCTIDVTSNGAAAVTHHEGPETAYHATVADIDSNPPVGEFNFVPSAPGPPNCEGWETGQCELTSNYIWPVIDYDVIDGDTILHVVSTEASSELAPKVKTLVYYRKVNGEWPSCGAAIDSVHAVSAVVRSSPISDRVAIVWLKPIYYVGDSDDPCGFKDWQHDVVYSESTNGGEHWGTMVNVSDYSQGSTVPITEVEQLAYNDLTALYVGDTLHIVWETPLRDVVNEPCDPLYASRLWHWDSNNQCISIVYDGSRPRYHCYVGTWNNSLAKMNLSECDGKLYVSFTRFGAYTSENGDTNIDCSASGYANGEIFLAASTNAGIIWGEAQNITNTFTPGCEAGDCLSEHWSSMAKYSTEVLHLQYIEDHDAGGIVFMEGAWTENPVKYLSYPCFTPETYCEVVVSPVEVSYPTYISPLGQTGCTGDETVTIGLIISNTGTENTSYTILPSDGWIHPEATSSDIPAGCDNVDTIQVTLGPIEVEGIYTGNISVTACGEDEFVVPIELHVYCEFWFPEFAVLSTGCWSIGVWTVARTGTGVWYDPEGNMYWFLDEVSFMYDESLVITYADDTAKTWFSINDGSDSNVGFVALDMLSTETMGSYEYAHCAFGTGDTAVTGEVDYYLPMHPDSCFIIERIEVCNNTDTLVRLHIGEAIDWNIPDGQGGSENQCGKD